MQWWYVGAASNIAILVFYLAISFTIFRGLLRTGQLISNPLGLATAAIFFTCAVHHGSHPVHQLLPYAGLEEHSGLAMREVFNDWHLSAWDVITAAVAAWYWSLRGRYPALVRGAAIFEDIKARQRQALDIHDNVVQGLATAKLSFELGESDKGLKAVEATLAASRTIITDLLGEEGSETALAPGDLRRREATPSPPV